MNLINLREAPIVDKAKEGATLFALNTDGTVERISAENVGGGGNIAMMKVTSEYSSVGAGGSQVCICENMTYEEAVELITSSKPLQVIEIRNNVFYPATKVRYAESEEKIYITTDNDEIQWTSSLAYIEFPPPS